MSSRSLNAIRIATLLQDEGSKVFLSNVTKLAEGCLEIESYYREYDLDEKTEANGFRSFVKIVSGFMARLTILLTRDWHPDENGALVKEYEVVSSTLVKIMEIMRLVRRRGANPDYSQTTDQDIDILSRVFQFTEPDIRPFYSLVGTFWIRSPFIPEYRRARFFVTLLSLPSFRQKVKFMYDREFAQSIMTRNAIVCSVECMKRSANLQQFPVNILMKRVKKPTKVRRVNEPNHCEWVIEVIGDDSHATVRHIMRQERKKKQKPISLLIAEPRVGQGETRRKKVIFHCHGGGGICCSAENYQFLLSHCASQLGVTIICPDYRKAPEHPYPAGLQDLMQAYLFLTSRSKRVEQMLGFLPDTIVLAGDSGGSYFSLSLTIALNMIRQTGCDTVQMPAGISMIYPIIHSGPVVHPSSVMMPLDCLAHYSLPIAYYAGLKPVPSCDWHQRDGSAVEVMQRLAKRFGDPLLNPFAYQDYSTLDRIALRILVCEMDPALDQGIALARRWQGDVKVHVARELPHAFILSANPEPTYEEVWKMLRAMVDLLTI